MCSLHHNTRIPHRVSLLSFVASLRLWRHAASAAPAAPCALVRVRELPRPSARATVPPSNAGARLLDMAGGGGSAIGENPRAPACSHVEVGWRPRSGQRRSRRGHPHPVRAPTCCWLLGRPGSLCSHGLARDGRGVGSRDLAMLTRKKPSHFTHAVPGSFRPHAISSTACPPMMRVPCAAAMCKDVHFCAWKTATAGPDRSGHRASKPAP